MNQRLCIGIQNLTSEWEELLDELGVWYETINYSTLQSDHYIIAILNEIPDQQQITKLAAFLDEGGSVLEMKDIGVFINKNQIRTSFQKTVINRSGSNIFKHIPFIDVYSEITLHKDSTILEGLVHYKSQENGTVGFFGADVSSLLKKTGYARKKFYGLNSKHPNELVSKVSKHELLESFRVTIAELHFRRKLPFIQKWNSPDIDPVFCFRIDSDFGDPGSIDKLYKATNKYDIKATWFLHVEAHETWLEHFKNFNDQEIALHGYKHGTSVSEMKTKANIQKGKEILEDAGFNIDGFCAPYGIWNTALKNSLEHFKFKYSSEFTFKYDGTPSYNARGKASLQIPIHPICTGSLNRQHYSEEQMSGYFMQTIQHKNGRFEPVIFYHHPLQPGLNVIERIFELIQRYGFTNLTFSEYADFWTSRKDFGFEAETNGEQLLLSSVTNSPILLQISYDHSGFHLVRPKVGGVNFGNSNKCEYSNSYIPDKQEVENMRAISLRSIKTSLLDWKNRIRL